MSIIKHTTFFMLISLLVSPLQALDFEALNRDMGMFMREHNIRLHPNPLIEHNNARLIAHCVMSDIEKGLYAHYQLTNSASRYRFVAENTQPLNTAIVKTGAGNFLEMQCSQVATLIAEQLPESVSQKNQVFDNTLLVMLQTLNAASAQFERAQAVLGYQRR